MGRIDSLHINNFKFFDKQEPLKIGGKHLLLYGENGSGKSSIYWSLYTLFEAAVKTDTDEIEKYFMHPDDHNESLINIHSDEIIETDGTIHYDSYIKVVTDDIPPLNYNVSLLDTSISGDFDAVEINLASDFINYKMLFKFQDFWNGETINLASIFEGYVLPYVKFPAINILRSGVSQPRTSAIEMWQEIKIGPGTTENANGKIIQVYKSSEENKQFERFANHFEAKFNDLIDFINVNAPNMLKQLGYDIDFQLIYIPHNHKKADSKYHYTPFKVELKITSYLGKVIDIHRPQSFLNEAKITAIALAIRLSILKKRINEQAPDVLKFIVFDDVMISLDMNNRDRLMDYLLNPTNNYTEDYQLFFLTHDKNLFDFIAYKIKHWDNIENWVLKEMYTGKDRATNKEFPVIIDSELEFIDKAHKYYDIKDYTACSIFIRKELEKIVNKRLPDELKYKSDGTFLSLQTLWNYMLSRYEALGNPISEEVKKLFSETKLMVLNPQAHFQNISLPVYKVELDKAFELIDKLNNDYPIPFQTILLSKGMQLEFKHPNLNYTFDFELLSDYYIDDLNGAKIVKLPKCQVSKWQYNGTDFAMTDGTILQQPEIDKIQKRKEDKLDKVLENLKRDAVLQITNQMFIDNTMIVNSIWSLKETLDKAGITI